MIFKKTIKQENNYTFHICFFVLLFFCFFVLLSGSVYAQADVVFTPQITIGEFQAEQARAVDGNTIGAYISAIYRYGVGVVGIVAAVVMMFGGLLWLTAGGDSGRVGEAKEWIKASLLGLILALLSYTILATVNPDLVNFRSITVTTIEQSTDIIINDENITSGDGILPPITPSTVCTENDDCSGGYCEPTELGDSICQFGEDGQLCTTNKVCKSGLRCITTTYSRRLQICSK